MKNTLETRLGIFFALALIAAFIVIEMAGGLEFLRRGYRLHALFENVQELKAGDPVKMAGVEIGRVENIQLTDDKVQVTMRIDRGAVVRTDSRAMIRFTGLMGQNFVAVDFGTPTGVKAADGAYLETAEQPDLAQIMLKLDNVASGVENLTKSFSGEQISNLLGPFTDFLNQNGPRLSTIFENVETISADISEGRGTIGRLIKEDELYTTTLEAVREFQTTATELQGIGEDIQTISADARSFLESANLTIGRINEGEGTIGRLVTDETLYTETTTAMTNLREILEKMNRGEGTFGRLISDDSLIRNVNISLQKLDRATESIEDQGPLSILGIAINSLF